MAFVPFGKKGAKTPTKKTPAKMPMKKKKGC
jgi:hypothetical protein